MTGELSDQGKVEDKSIAEEETKGPRGQATLMLICMDNKSTESSAREHDSEPDATPSEKGEGLWGKA